MHANGLISSQYLPRSILPDLVGDLICGEVRYQQRYELARHDSALV